MGVRRLFLQGRAKFSGVGAKNILFALKTLENILFSFFQKVENYTILAGQGPEGAPCLESALMLNVW